MKKLTCIKCGSTSVTEYLAGTGVVRVNHEGSLDPSYDLSEFNVKTAEQRCNACGCYEVGMLDHPDTDDSIRVLELMQELQQVAGRVLGGKVNVIVEHFTPFTENSQEIYNAVSEKIDSWVVPNAKRVDEVMKMSRGERFLFKALELDNSQGEVRLKVFGPYLP